MQKALCCQAEADQARYVSSNSSEDADYPGRQSVSTNQLWDEHTTFLNALPDYLGYGEGKSKDYYCPCSGSMKKWQEGIDLTIPSTSQCKGKYAQLSHLLDHCSKKGDVYHSGFQEYVRTMTGWGQQGVTMRENTRTRKITGAPDNESTPAAGQGADGVVEEANANLGHSSPYTALASDARVRHK